jgi:2-dehydro-3-deoxygluconokinase
MTRPFDLVAIGEAMVEFNQVRGGDGRTYLQGFGGDTSNATVAAARQGARCAYITRVGDDDFGRLCMDLWHQERIDCRGVGVDPSAPTGIYFVRHADSGHSFSYLRAGSAASRMHVSDIPEALLRATRSLHVSAISQAISEGAEQAVAHALRIAREAGALVSYDPNLRLALWTLERARRVIVATLPLCDEFLPSLDDLRKVSGLDQPRDIIAWSHEMGARQVVLKLGEQGALVSDGHCCEAVQAFRVASKDATGAGDCFDGSYITRRIAGDDPIAATRWACAAAALATMGYGAVAPLPSGEQVEAFLRLHC